MNKKQVVTRDTNLDELAHFVHGEICNCDDKTCDNETMILDWLKDGNPYGCTVDEICLDALSFFFGDDDF